MPPVEIDFPFISPQDAKLAIDMASLRLTLRHSGQPQEFTVREATDRLLAREATFLASLPDSDRARAIYELTAPLVAALQNCTGIADKFVNLANELPLLQAALLQWGFLNSRPPDSPPPPEPTPRN
jgi:hypothetical protein